MKKAIKVLILALCITLPVVNSSALSTSYLTGDLNADGSITAEDALTLLQKVSGNIDTFPVEEVPAEYTVNVTTYDETKNYDNYAELILKLEYPVVEITNNPIASETINQVLEQVKVPFTAIDEMSESYTQDIEGGYNGSAFEISSTFETIQNGDILTVLVNEYEYWGGTHGYSSMKAFNFDINTGAWISRSMLVEDYSTFLNYYVAPVVYNEVYDAGFINYEYEVSSVMQDYSWYINENGEYVEFFNPYGVAPYAAGIVKIILPQAEEYFRDYYKTTLHNN